MLETFKFFFFQTICRVIVGDIDSRRYTGPRGKGGVRPSLFLLRVFGHAHSSELENVLTSEFVN